MARCLPPALVTLLSFSELVALTLAPSLQTDHGLGSLWGPGSLSLLAWVAVCPSTVQYVPPLSGKAGQNSEETDETEIASIFVIK